MTDRGRFSREKARKHVEGNDGGQTEDTHNMPKKARLNPDKIVGIHMDPYSIVIMYNMANMSQDFI